MKKRFNVAVATPDGGLELHPLKDWLRHHPDFVPKGQNATTSTSHQLRAALAKAGWEVRESDEQVVLVKPDAGAQAGALDKILGEEAGAREDAERNADLLFPLERHLRDFMSRHIETLRIQGRRVRLYVDADGREGVEYPTGVGPIDILGLADDGGFVVFELKVDRGPDRAVGQLLRYMGWVKRHLAIEKPVRGVIVAASIDERLKYAAVVVPDVSILEYEVSFKLNDAGIDLAPGSGGST